MIALTVGTLLVSGFCFILAGVIGVLRLPDFYSRLHAVSKCDTLGLTLIVVAAALHEGLSLTSLKILLIAGVIAFANSTAAHALGRAAFRCGLQPWLAERDER